VRIKKIDVASEAVSRTLRKKSLRVVRSLFLTQYESGKGSCLRADITSGVYFARASGKNGSVSIKLIYLK
jgi:hypothetical protein